MQSFELFIGLRYTRARQRSRFISFISLVSVIGIALGITVLITVLSVMNGFQREVRTRILSVASHIQISGPANALNNWPGVAEKAKQNPAVIAAAPYVSAQGLLSSGGTVRGAYIRGIIPEDEEKVADLARHMTTGNLELLKAGEFGIVLGIELARALSVAAGDKVVLIAPQGQVTPAGIMPRLRQFTVVGIFSVDHYEYDSGLGLVNMQDAQTLYRMGEQVSGVRLKLADLFAAPRVSRELMQSLGPDSYITDWTRLNANFFRAVDIEKRMMFLIVFLIIAVAAFNIVSSLFMAVKDKQADIAILRTLGASPGSVMKIFLIQGTLIGLMGTLAGVVAGIALALNVDVVVPFIENLFGFKFLSKDVYQISDLPSELRAADVLLTAFFSFIVSLLATIYPSYRAAKINPAEALRYE
ncbi:MAG: LolC/E family lipoprotein releasing system, transrane protein [Betaproteobacteria bacterium]|nr:LolC/E family lipoprotein releasing system, transrane protein [Betaproteobacteria bacterium]